MPLTLTQILALLPDNTTGDISEADARDALTAIYNSIPYVDRYRMAYQTGETPHADDDFFTSYSGYTELAVTGSATWAASNNGLSCSFNTQTQNDFAVTLKAMSTGSPPVTIETMFMGAMSQTNNPGFGMCFTDGVLSTSNGAALGPLSNFGNARFAGTLTSMSPTALTQHENRYWQQPSLWRLVWRSANTFAWCMSPDGGSTWTDFGQTDFSTTFTPTHLGLWVSSWSQSTKQVATFPYLRVYDADLSV